MFDLERFSENHPELGHLVEEVRGLRDHIIQEYRLGMIDEPIAARLLIVEPHVLRTLGGRILAPVAKEVVKSPNVAEKTATFTKRPRGIVGTEFEVYSAAEKLSDGSGVCPPYVAIERETGLRPGTVSATISKLRSRGKWPFASRKSVAQPTAAVNGKAR